MALAMTSSKDQRMGPRGSLIRTVHRGFEQDVGVDLLVTVADLAIAADFSAAVIWTRPGRDLRPFADQAGRLTATAYSAGTASRRSGSRYPSVHPLGRP